METVKRGYRSLEAFCTAVVEWRSAFTVPYVILLNVCYWSTVFYGTHEIHLKCLLGLAGIIFFWDILLTPTENRSVFFQILLWPIRDFWRTFAFVLCLLSTNEIRKPREDYALWYASAAMCCLIIGPVYRYNRITERTIQLFADLGSLTARSFNRFIVQPLIRLYENISYIVLLKWLPGLGKYLRSLMSRFGGLIDYYVLQYVRKFFHRTGEILKYWVYFYWWTDLRAWAHTRIYLPLADKLKIVQDYLVYIVYGHWLKPLGRYIFKISLDISYYVMGILNQCAIAIGNSVVWPIIVFGGKQLEKGFWIFYDIAIQPVVDILHQKYKFLEDQVFIYVLGPVCKKIVDNAPEKNPFRSKEFRY
uniref:Uncharacterized protein n=1 Tax=Acrobeloides nanus TaxID=290746 RepID=A0A914CY08_9BILA